MKTFKEFLNESSSNREYADKQIGLELRKRGIAHKIDSKVGYTSFDIKNYSIVNDGVGIDLTDNGKSIYYGNNVKLAYKTAIDKLENLLNQ